MFTVEERTFIEHNPKFIDLLRDMTDQELFVFREIVAYICDLSSEEKRMFFARIDEVLAEMKRPKCHFQ